MTIWRLARRALAGAALLALAACVQTRTGTVLQPANEAEAAEYNLQLGISYLRQGNLQAAREKLEKAIEQDPGSATAHAALGLVYERLDDADGAERNYRKSVSLDRNDPDSLNSLAVFLCSKRGQPEEGLRYFDRALSIPLSQRNANRAMLNTNAGTCAKRVDLERAEAYLRAALALQPGSPDVLLQLADVAYLRGNYLQARAFLERYLAVSQPGPAALWLGVRVEQALGAADAARNYADQLRTSFPASVEAGLLLEQERGEG